MHHGLKLPSPKTNRFKTHCSICDTLLVEFEKTSTPFGDRKGAQILNVARSFVASTPVCLPCFDTIAPMLRQVVTDARKKNFPGEESEVSNLEPV